MFAAISRHDLSRFLTVEEAVLFADTQDGRACGPAYIVFRTRLREDGSISIEQIPDAMRKDVSTMIKAARDEQEKFNRAVFGPMKNEDVFDTEP